MPDVEVAGILHEIRQAPQTPRTPRTEALRRVAAKLRDPDYLRYLAHKTARWVGARLDDAGARALHFLHGTTDPALQTLEEFAHECQRRDIVFLVTDDIHAEVSLRFVGALEADLAIVFGTRILKEKLFELPRLGSINSHQHKLPDYRGSGPPGLWELRDGRKEVTVTVHRVTAEVDGGAILDERSYPIEPFDTLAILELKANVLGVDGLAAVVEAQSRGPVAEAPQHSVSTTFKGIPDHTMWAMERGVAASRPVYRPADGRLSLRAAAAALSDRGLGARKLRGRSAVILAGPAPSDRGEPGSLPTAQFLRQVRFLKRHYRVVSLRDVRNTAAGLTVALTFDIEEGADLLGLRAVVEPERLPVCVCVRTGDDLPWDELRRLDRHGAVIASLGRTLFDPTSLDEELLADQVEGSRDDLRRELGYAVDHFAFPVPEVSGSPSKAARQIATRTYSRVLPARRRYPEALWQLELAISGHGLAVVT